MFSDIMYYEHSKYIDVFRDWLTQKCQEYKEIC